jgi:hypothetical protein
MTATERKGPDQIAMLLFRDEGIDHALFSDDERGKAFFQKFVDWAADLDRRGILVGVDPLVPGGKTVRKKGASIVVDGPYAEGREAVLGYYMVRVATLDDACALAAESPHTQAGGATEVRLVGAFPKP